jgi:lipoyl(octanoyl) transferase
MDLTPFEGIDPCGYVGLKVTQSKNLGIDANLTTISELLLNILKKNLANGQENE